MSGRMGTHLFDPVLIVLIANNQGSVLAQGYDSLRLREWGKVDV